ncbi:MAG: GNAT family N-acetyltransferase [Candidatus Pristimantibacillus sp.]
MNELQLRLIEEHELEEALRLEQSCYSAEAAATQEGFAHRFNRYPNYFWSAWLGEKLVGIANGVRTSATQCGDDLKGEQKDTKEGNNFCILTIAVDPEVRHQRIGTQLLKKLIEECTVKEHSFMLLMCERHLVRFYEQAGFQYMGLAASNHGGIEWYEMRRPMHTMEHPTE